MNDKLFKVLVCLGMIGVALAPSSVFAQSCGTRRVVVITHAPTIVHTPIIKEIVTPIAVPVLIPAYQFQYSPPCVTPGFAAPHVGYQQPQQQQGYQQYQQQGYQQYQQGNSQQVPPQCIQPGQPGQNQQEMVRVLAKALLEEMSRQSQTQVPGGPPDTGPPAALPLLSTNPNPFPTALPNQFTPGQNGLALANFAFNTTVRNCAACHTGIGSKGDTIIFSQPGVLNPAAPWKTMAKEVQEGRMPRRDSQYRLSPDEGQAILAWYTEMGRQGR